MKRRELLKAGGAPDSTISPPKATTKVLPRNAWIHGAAARNQETKLAGWGVRMLGGGRRRDAMGEANYRGFSFRDN